MGANKVEVMSGNIRHNSDMTFSTYVSLRIAENGQVSSESETDAGTFTRSGTSFQFNYAEGTPDTGSLNGDVLTITTEGLTLVFEK